MTANRLSLAFYKGTGTLLDRSIRWATCGQYSHVELADPASGLGLSSSWRDGGVRIKQIDFESGHWDLVPVPWVAHNAAWGRAAQHVGARYDLVGILGSHALSLSRHNRSAWFCSELCAYAMGLQVPHSYSPQGLFRAVALGADAFHQGCVLGKSARGKGPAVSA